MGNRFQAVISGAARGRDGVVTRPCLSPHARHGDAAASPTPFSLVIMQSALTLRTPLTWRDRAQGVIEASMINADCMITARG